DESLLRRELVSGPLVVAESVRIRLEHRERLDVGLLLRSVGSSGCERDLDLVTGFLRCLLDARTAAEDDDVSERDSLPTRLRAVEVLLDLFKGLQDLGQFCRVVDFPILLRRETNARAVGTPALIGAAEARR